VSSILVYRALISLMDDILCLTMCLCTKMGHLMWNWNTMLSRGTRCLCSTRYLTSLESAMGPLDDWLYETRAARSMSRTKPSCRILCSMGIWISYCLGVFILCVLLLVLGVLIV
jgi:hypothetical protein